MLELNTWMGAPWYLGPPYQIADLTGARAQGDNNFESLTLAPGSSARSTQIRGTRREYA